MNKRYRKDWSDHLVLTAETHSDSCMYVLQLEMSDIPSLCDEGRQMPFKHSMTITCSLFFFIWLCGKTQNGEKKSKITFPILDISVYVF